MRAWKHEYSKWKREKSRTAGKWRLWSLDECYDPAGWPERTDRNLPLPPLLSLLFGFFRSRKRVQTWQREKKNGGRTKSRHDGGTNEYRIETIYIHIPRSVVRREVVRRLNRIQNFPVCAYRFVLISCVPFTWTTSSLVMNYNELAADKSGPEEKADNYLSNELKLASRNGRI